MSSLNKVANFVSSINVAIRLHLELIPIRKSTFVLELVDLLYQNGAIRGFCIKDDVVEVFLKYQNSKSVISSFTVVSTPGKRVFWRLPFLSKEFKVSNFSGFYVISTDKGLMTSTECLLMNYNSGEVIFKIEF